MVSLEELGFSATLRRTSSDLSLASANKVSEELFPFSATAARTSSFFSFANFAKISAETLLLEARLIFASSLSVDLRDSIEIDSFARAASLTGASRSFDNLSKTSAGVPGFLATAKRTATC